MTDDTLAAEEAQVSPEDLNEEEKIMLVFSYLWVLAIVPFLVTRREYVRWHAKQGLILCGCSPSVSSIYCCCTWRSPLCASSRRCVASVG